MKDDTKEIVSYVFVGGMTTPRKLCCLFPFVKNTIVIVNR